MSQVSAHVDGSKPGFDRRVHARRSVRSLAYVELGEGNGGIVLNVSEGGIAVQAVMSLLGDELPAVRVQLSHSKKSIEARGRISWTSGLRKTAGLEFVGLSPEARSLLREWVAMETPSGELIEEMTSPIEKSSLEAAAQPPSTEAAKLDLKRGFVLSPPEKPSKLAESLSAAKEEVAEPFLQRRMSRDLPDIEAIPAPTALSAPATPAEPAVNVHVAATVPFAPPSAEADSPGLLHPSASLPDDRFGFKQLRSLSGLPAAAPPEDRWKIAKLVAIFAGVSLAAGWFAGHGALHGKFGKAAKETPNDAVAAGNPETAPPANPNISNIEVVDLNNQHWLIPMQGPLGPSRPPTGQGSSSASEQVQKSQLKSDVSLPAPEPAKNQVSGSDDKSSRPLLNPSSGGPESVLPGSAASNSQPVVPLPTPAAAADDPEAKNLRSGELIHRVDPVYPPSALAQGIEGTVTLYAVIASDGTVRNLQSLDGPPALVPAALAAVRQWRYSPSLLNGRPIQTERQIKIHFELSPPPQ
jgi:TonB family protein